MINQQRILKTHRKGCKNKMFSKLTLLWVQKDTTVTPRYNDLRYNDIPDITMEI